MSDLLLCQWEMPSQKFDSLKATSYKLSYTSV